MKTAPQTRVLRTLPAMELVNLLHQNTNSNNGSSHNESKEGVRAKIEKIKTSEPKLLPKKGIFFFSDIFY